MRTVKIKPDQWWFLLFLLFAVLTAPTLEITTLEFPDKHVLPIGYNVTIICTSKASKENYGSQYNGQPYWIQYYFNDVGLYIKDCGGRDGDVDSEDSKVCTFSIQNATQKDSGNYTCWAHNQMTCTEGTLNLQFRGNLQYTHLFLNYDLSFKLYLSTKCCH